MDFFKYLIQRTFFSTNRYLDEKDKPTKTKDKGDNKRKRIEKTRESEKRSYKKEKNKDEKRKEKKKKNMKGNQWIHFKMDFLYNWIKRTFCSTSRYRDGKEKPKMKKD